MNAYDCREMLMSKKQIIIDMCEPFIKLPSDTAYNDSSLTKMGFWKFP